MYADSTQQFNSLFATIHKGGTGSYLPLCINYREKQMVDLLSPFPFYYYSLF